MTKKCCIRECKGNYNKENRRKVFRLPNNETERKLWLSSIPKSTLKQLFVKIIWSKNTTLMSRRRKLRPINPPSIFKVSASGEKFAVSKTKRSLPSVRNILHDELPAFEEHDRFTIPSTIHEKKLSFETLARIV